MRGWALGLALAAIAVGAWAQGFTGPPPETLSEAGRAAMTAMAKGPQGPPDNDLAARRAFLDKFQADFGASQRKRYAVDIEASTMAGVPVRLIRSKGTAAGGDLVLLNLHGGGFNADSGSLTENIPIAAMTKIPVVAVLYRLAPEHPFPAAVDDALAVYRELLKTHKSSQIGVFGTSAGAILGPELIARLHKDHLPQPAVLGVFSGTGDFAHRADSVPPLMAADSKAYLGPVPFSDPLASPALGPVGFFPPTLCLASSRDFLLSPTVNFCRRLELAGVPNKLVVWDGLPHAFWAYMAIPESDEAFGVMAKFLEGRLKERR
jgi:monoterpene epsilon-lactone hydrolase